MRLGIRNQLDGTILSVSAWQSDGGVKARLSSGQDPTAAITRRAPTSSNSSPACR